MKLRAWSDDGRLCAKHCDERAKRSNDLEARVVDVGWHWRAARRQIVEDGCAMSLCVVSLRFERNSVGSIGLDLSLILVVAP